jgi:site-specific DNA recombinase
MIKDPNCKNKNWKMIELDNLVFDEIRKLTMDPNYFYEIRENSFKNTDNPSKIAILRKEIEEIEIQISRFMDLYGIGKFTIQQVSDKVDPLNERKNGLEKELSKLNAESGILSEEETFELLEDFEEILDEGDFHRIRTTIETLISFIEIDNEDIYIHWKFA